MPKIFEEEPGELGAQYKPEPDHLAKHATHQLDFDAAPKPTKRRIFTQGFIKHNKNHKYFLKLF